MAIKKHCFGWRKQAARLCHTRLSHTSKSRLKSEHTKIATEKELLDCLSLSLFLSFALTKSDKDYFKNANSMRGRLHRCIFISVILLIRLWQFVQSGRVSRAVCFVTCARVLLVTISQRHATRLTLDVEGGGESVRLCVCSFMGFPVCVCWGNGRVLRTCWHVGLQSLHVRA